MVLVALLLYNSVITTSVKMSIDYDHILTSSSNATKGSQFRLTKSTKEVG